MMNTSYDEDATSWRDLATQLTPDQVAELEYCEREKIPPGIFSAQSQLNCARGMVEHNIIQALCADVPAPPEATGLCEWETWTGGSYARMFDIASSRSADGMSVLLLGIQHHDGRIERFVSARLENGDNNMSPAEARRFANLLVEAADRLDGFR